MRKALRLMLSVILVVTGLLSTNMAWGQSSGYIKVTDLRTENVNNPLGIDVIEPRLSWKLNSSERGQYQTAYHIQVASSESKLLANNPDLWDTGKVESDQSVHVAYRGKPLESKKRYVWRVKVWDKHGNASEWSEPAWWEMGLLDETHWQAEWISYGDGDNEDINLEGAHWIWYPEGNPGVNAPGGVSYFRYVFALPADQHLAKAEMLLTADDVYLLYVNGDLADISPQETDAWKQARLIDVTHLLSGGSNVISIIAMNAEAPGNNAAGVIGRMRIEYETGETFVVETDSEWKTSKTIEQGWQEPDYDDADWSYAIEIAPYGGALWGNKVQLPQDDKLTLDGLVWVWYPEGNPAQGAPQAERYFRKTFDIPADREITNAEFLLTSDDWFVMFVNGERVANSPRVFESWKEAVLVDVTSALQPGPNTIAIEVTNDESAAGLIGALKIDFEAGESLHVHIDGLWKAAKDKQQGWELPGFDDSDWVSALEVATYGDSPWGTNVNTNFSLGAPYLRKSFSVQKPIDQARLYSTALGVYEPYLNGERVGEDIFAPGWTDYHTRIQYQTYDVTELLQNGENVIGAMLGEGWYAGHIGLVGTHVYGDKPQLLMQLEIDYADGSTETMITDGTWKWAWGPIVSSDMLMGETYDARKEIPGWNTPNFDDADWSGVVVWDGDIGAQLVAQADPPVQVMQEIQPVKVTEPEPGTYIFDLGQNMVGTVRLKVSGEAGETITLRYAEVLNPDGTLYTTNLRKAKATDYYTLKGGGDEVYEPHFTFHGFRFVEVTGYSGEPTEGMITGLVMHTAAPVSGQFETSNDMLNQLQSNIVWGQRGNFLSIPTDTPARDERLGWTGDINVFVGTATFNMDVSRFLGSKWLQDLRDAQSANGAYPDVAPTVCCGMGNAGWADAGVTVPYTIWQRYGDTRVIEENYDAMVAWIHYMHANSSGYIRPAPDFGDWLNLNDNTPGDVISTAYFAYSTKLLAEMASAIGRNNDAAVFEQLFNQIKAAFNRAFVSADGRIAGNSQTAYVLALHMDLLPEEKRSMAAGHLVERIQQRNWHLSTGFLGTRDLLPVLSENGYLDVAYRLLLNDTFPSWGYQIQNGATTMWERWDSIRPDGSFQDAGMNSFNHYAYGAVGDWMYRNIAGIQHDPDHPGYKHTIIHPRPGGDLTYAKGEYESVYGSIVSEWQQQDGTFKLHVIIPVNTTATVFVPADSEWSVTESGQLAHEAEGVTFIGMKDGHAVFDIGSGEYRFVSQEE